MIINSNNITQDKFKNWVVNINEDKDIHTILITNNWLKENRYNNKLFVIVTAMDLIQPPPQEAYVIRSFSLNHEFSGRKSSGVFLKADGTGGSGGGTKNIYDEYLISEDYAGGYLYISPNGELYLGASETRIIPAGRWLIEACVLPDIEVENNLLSNMLMSKSMSKSINNDSDDAEEEESMNELEEEE